MKKKLCFLLSVITVLTLFSACSRNRVTDGTEEKLITVGFSQVGSESDWRLANTASMRSALSEENGYRLLFDNAKQKQENQYLAIRNFIQQDVDYIVLAPISETGWDSVLQEAHNAGIPVMIVDRQVSVDDDSLYRSWVGSDFYQEGMEAIAWLEKTFPDESEEIRILHLQGTDGATAQLMRSKALFDASEKHPNWKILATLKGEFTEAKGYEVVRDFLKTGETFRVLYSENDNMTFGAMRALDEAGLTYGEDGEIAVISFDAVRKALEYCFAGRISLCVECNPLHGPRIDHLIKATEAHQEVPRLSYVEETSFTPGSLTEEIIRAREY